jgi:predicted transcriptional regulator
VANIEISTKVEESVWKELEQLAQRSHQDLSDLLTEAIREYLGLRRVRPEVLRHLDESIAENQQMGRLLVD